VKTAIYARVSTIGGCGIHNVLILMYPSNSDWDRIADTMDDNSWSSTNMRQYFQRLEQCRYIMPGTLPDQRHGFNGWQPNELEDPNIFTSDPQSQAFIRAGANHLGNSTAYNDWVQNKLDINSWDVVRNDQEGMFAPPLTRMRAAVRWAIPMPSPIITMILRARVTVPPGVVVPTISKLPLAVTVWPSLCVARTVKV